MYRIELRNTLEDLPVLERALASFASDRGLTRDDLNRLNLVLEELMINVISYAYDDQDEHQIVVRLGLENDELVIEVEDDGRPFNPLEVPPPDLDRPLIERQVGGLGLHLVRNFVDEIHYRRIEGKNVLSLSKRRSGTT